MKLFAFIVFFFSSLSLASVGPSKPLSAVDKIYECGMYTVNSFSSEKGFTSDNPAVTELSVIHQDATTFTIAPNTIWEKGTVFTNDVGGTLSGMAGNTEETLVKKTNDYGTPYFMIFHFDEKQPVKVWVLGQCIRK